MIRNASGVEPQPRPQVVGPEAVVGVPLTRAPELAEPAALERAGRPPACGRRSGRAVGAGLERAEHVERRDAAARAVRDVAVDRQHDRRPVERVHELRGDDADDAAMPALAGDDEHVVRADLGIGLDDLLRLRRRCPPLPRWRRVFSSFELLGQRPRLVGHAPRRRRAAAASAMSGVLMRPAALTRGASMNADVIAVDASCRSGRQTSSSARRPDLVRALATASRARAWR